MKLCLGLFFVLFFNSGSFADDNIKVVIATQTYHCEIKTNLDCKPINEIAQKEIILKKDGGSAGVTDKEHGLSADVDTTFKNGNISYGITLCSSTACTLSTVTSDSSGSINQLMTGQYNITEKSFDVLAFFIATTSAVDFSSLSFSLFSSLKDKFLQFKNVR